MCFRPVPRIVRIRAVLAGSAGAPCLRSARAQLVGLGEDVDGGDSGWHLWALQEDAERKGSGGSAAKPPRSPLPHVASAPQLSKAQVAAASLGSRTAQHTLASLPKCVVLGETASHLWVVRRVRGCADVSSGGM